MKLYIIKENKKTTFLKREDIKKYSIKINSYNSNCFELYIEFETCLGKYSFSKSVETHSINEEYLRFVNTLTDFETNDTLVLTLEF
jgi:hypothetical protein